jgi:hypothetical protein
MHAQAPHLVFAVWKTNHPFDKKHYASDKPLEPHVAGATPAVACLGATGAAHEKGAGHKRDLPSPEVVTAADSTVGLTPSRVKATAQPASEAPPKVDYAILRKHIAMDRILAHLGLLPHLRGRGRQRRAHCPVHSQSTAEGGTFSVHLGKNVFRCFHADCGLKGNALDLWAAIHRLPLYQAALHLAKTLGSRATQKTNP